MRYNIAVSLRCYDSVTKRAILYRTQPSTFAIRISQRINQKLQKSLPVFHRFFADPKNKIGTVLKLKMN